MSCGAHLVRVRVGVKVRVGVRVSWLMSCGAHMRYSTGIHRPQASASIESGIRSPTAFCTPGSSRRERLGLGLGFGFGLGLGSGSGLRVWVWVKVRFRVRVRVRGRVRVLGFCTPGSSSRQRPRAE
eukprot:scaffold81413_cov42-Phaeocystis_antarctica.AAC.1